MVLCFYRYNLRYKHRKSENVKLAASPQFIFSDHLRIRRYSALNKYLPSLDRCQPSIHKCLHFEPAINIVAVYKWAPEKKVAPERKSRARKKTVALEKKSRQIKQVAPKRKSRARKKSRAREKKSRLQKKSRQVIKSRAKDKKVFAKSKK